MKQQTAEMYTQIENLYFKTSHRHIFKLQDISIHKFWSADYLFMCNFRTLYMIAVP